MDLPELKPLPEDYGDLIGLLEFMDAVENLTIMDFDGCGHWATKNGMDDTIEVKPSLIYTDVLMPPEWATHIMFFCKCRIY